MESPEPAHHSAAGDSLLRPAATELDTVEDEAGSQETSENESKQPHSGTAEEIQEIKSSATISMRMRCWIWETVALLVATMALVAVVIVLRVYNGKTLPHWPYGISINALVAVFSALFKIGLAAPVAEAISQLKWSWFTEKARPLSHLEVFDSASRGKWLGAMRLIFYQRGVHLGALGAVIIVLAAATEPSFQQVVRYRPCSQQIASDHAYIASINSFNGSSLRYSGYQYQLSDAGMQASISKGVYYASSPVQPVCKTGNCTFPDYRTLGMCSGCNDITDQIKTGNKKGYTQWNLPSGLTLGMEYMDDITLNMSTTYFVPSDPDGLPPPPGSDSSNGTAMIMTEIIRFHTIHETQDPSAASAERCWLSPCVRTYNLQLNSSEGSEMLLSTQLLPRPTQGAATDELETITWSDTPSPCLLDGVYLATDNGTTSDLSSLPAGCHFEYRSAIGFEQYIATFLTGIQMTFRPEGIQDAAPDWLQQLCVVSSDDVQRTCNLASISAFWSTIADAITTYMRQNGITAPGAAANGEILETQTCIQVRWAWLSLPAILLVLAMWLLLATMIHTCRRSAPQIWKSSTLALLFHGFDEDLLHKAGEVLNTGKMEERAARLRVRISSADGVKFREEDGDKEI